MGIENIKIQDCDVCMYVCSYIYIYMFVYLSHSLVIGGERTQFSVYVSLKTRTKSWIILYYYNNNILIKKYKLIRTTAYICLYPAEIPFLPIKILII